MVRWMEAELRKRIGEPRTRVFHKLSQLFKEVKQIKRHLD